jgi:aerobic carbon-monoxide dehydrogenase medium subunit
MVARAGGGVRVAVTGAGPKAFRLPELEAALASRFAPESVGEEIVSPGDLRSSPEASAEYLAHLVSVMARRAVQACL